MNRKSFAIATLLSIVALGVPLTGCSNLLADAHYNNALTKYNEGDNEAALKFLDNAIAIMMSPNTTIIEELLIQSYRILKKRSRIFDKAIEIDPEDADSYYNRAVTREELGDTEGAMSDYNDAIKYDPESEAAYLNRGILKHDQGRFREAIEDYNKAIEINPNDVKAINNRGNSKL